MRLSTITNIAYVTTVVLTLTGGITMLLASNALEAERAAVVHRQDLDRQTSDVELEILRLSDRAREYVQTGNHQYLEDYQQLRGALADREVRVKSFENIGVQGAELEALSDAMQQADQLLDEQDAAISALQAGDEAEARNYLFDVHYESELDLIDSHITRFHSLLDQRTDKDVQQAEAVSRAWRSVSEGVLFLTALIFLCVLYFVLKRRILKPVLRLSDVVNRLADEDYSIEVSDYSTVDEIGDMAHAVRIFRENGLERQRLEAELARDLKLRNLMARMTQRMQACNSLSEIAGVVRRFVPVIIPACSGKLYVLNGDGTGMVETCSWLDPHESASEFEMTECWALRRGAMHYHSEQSADVMCAHLTYPETESVDSVCVPLMAQREIVGLLYIELPDEAARHGSENYLVMLAENIALSLANIELRETLRDLAMADPLTGLANRRQMDEKFANVLADRKRDGGPVSCIMIDVDYFKHFNDTYGHRAGDSLLKEVAHVLAASTREDGLAFRYGGEEFALLLPGVEPKEAVARAEKIRREIETLSVLQGDVVIGNISASFGVATTPDHGEGEDLFALADAALYKSKLNGRNRVTLATDVATGTQVA